MGMIFKLENAKHEEKLLLGFILTCKDFRSVSIFCAHPHATKSLQRVFKQCLFPQRIRDLFAFHNRERFPLQSELLGWPLYSTDGEFKRLKLCTEEFRVTTMNSSYMLPNYPAKFIVPASISDGTSILSLPCISICKQKSILLLMMLLADDIMACTQLEPKWKRAIIALCWRHPKTKGCLYRSGEQSSVNFPVLSTAPAPREPSIRGKSLHKLHHNGLSSFPKF